MTGKIYGLRRVGLFVYAGRQVYFTVIVSELTKDHPVKIAKDGQVLCRCRIWCQLYKVFNLGLINSLYLHVCSVVS